MTKFLLTVIKFARLIFRLGPFQAWRFFRESKKDNHVFSVRLRGMDQPVSLRGGTSDAWIFNQLLICEEYAGLISGTPKTILDGGANIGLASLYWASRFPGVNIVAVEPDPDNFSILCQNTSCFPGVTCVQGGLWPRQTKLRITNEKEEKYALQVHEDPNNGTIVAYTIPTIMERQNWDWIDVVKLDVEGSEVPILAENSREWIDRIGCLIIELHQDVAPHAAQVLFQAFADQNFQLSWRGENLIIRKK